MEKPVEMLKFVIYVNRQKLCCIKCSWNCNLMFEFLRRKSISFYLFFDDSNDYVIPLCFHTDELFWWVIFHWSIPFLVNTYHTE